MILRQIHNVKIAANLRYVCQGTYRNYHLVIHFHWCKMYHCYLMLQCQEDSPSHRVIVFDICTVMRFTDVYFIYLFCFGSHIFLVVTTVISPFSGFIVIFIVFVFVVNKFNSFISFHWCFHIIRSFS